MGGLGFMKVRRKALLAKRKLKNPPVASTGGLLVVCISPKIDYCLVAAGYLRLVWLA